MNNGLFDTTICARATGNGGAISVIRVSGPKAIELTDSIFTPAANGKTLSDAPGYSLHYGSICRDGRTIDDVVVSVFRAPASYTGEDSTEISCHASPYIVSEITSLLLEHGAEPATAGEFTKRAFLNGKMDLAQAEAVADVIAAESAGAHRVAMTQMKGGFSRELSAMRESLLRIASLMELELDFSEEEVEFADRSELRQMLDDTLQHIDGLISSFRLGNAIKNGVPVAIVGATNSGKSTLLNALIGEDRAIVSDIAGTTRDTIEEVFNIDGISFRFIDTAGIRETDETIEKIGIERSFKALSQASIVLGVIDATLPQADFEAAAQAIAGHISPASGQKLILLRNKVDLLDGAHVAGAPEVLAASDAGADAGSASDASDGRIGCPVLDISAARGTGLDHLRAALAECVGTELRGLSNDAVLVTNARHLEALRASFDALQRVREGLDITPALPTDLLTQDLREALYHLGSITGAISTDEILGNIFRNFCIGK